MEVETKRTGVELRRELRVRDLVFTQIIIVVGGTWIGTAGKLGPAHLALWLLAGLLFFVPLAVVVVHLSRWKPLEGGVYQWARLGLGEGVGFMVAWNLWVYTIVLISALGLDCATLLSYTLGERTKWLATSRPAIAGLTLGANAALAAFAVLGLSVGKWVHNVGGIVRLGCYAMLVALPLVHVFGGATLPRYSFELVSPAASLLSANILAKMGFGAYSGFEYVAIFAGESIDPARTIARSVYIAAPIVVLMFVLGTASVEAFVPPDQIDLIAPLPQALAAGATSGPTRLFAPIASVAMTVTLIAFGSANFSAAARLPMVAGWDGLLPSFFTRLHPRYKTPTGSILFVAAATVACAGMSLTGVGEQEAYQLVLSASTLSYALTYLAMFAIPMVARTGGLRPSAWIRTCALSGFAMTLFFIVFALLPIIRVASSVGFTGKVCLIGVGTNAVGALLLTLERRRRRARVEAVVNVRRR
jgi:amino acid transporter